MRQGLGMAAHHILLLSHYLEEGVMPLQDVDVQEIPRGKGTLAEGADVPVQGVVVVLVALQRVKHLAAPGDVAAELRHPARKSGHPCFELN